MLLFALCYFSWYCSELYNMLLYCIVCVFCGIIVSFIVRYCIELYSVVFRGIVVNCIVCSCIALFSRVFRDIVVTCIVC